MAACHDGGYDANFVVEVPELFKCCICQLALKNPVMIVPCGHRFCGNCFHQMEDFSDARNIALLCPLDRLAVDSRKVVADKGIERAVLDLKVKCDNNEIGCEWIDELRYLEKHLADNCACATMTCYKDGCTALVARGELDEHKKEYHPSKQDIWEELKELKKSVNVIKNELKAKDKEIDLIKSCCLDFSITQNASHCFTWKIHKSQGPLYSSKFLTSENGYLCRLTADWKRGATQDYFSVFFRICKGPYDVSLKWPFSKTVLLQMIDKGGMKHRSVINPSVTDPDLWKILPGNKETKGSGLSEWFHETDMDGFMVEKVVTIYCYVDPAPELFW